jgi:hypothetical protein
MKAYQRRVIKEKKELDKKAERLNAFISSIQFDSVPPIEQLALTIQYQVMNLYSLVLLNRISRFEP